MPGVYPDDYVIVRRQQTAENGDMVIALLDGKNNLTPDEQRPGTATFSSLISKNHPAQSV